MSKSGVLSEEKVRQLATSTPVSADEVRAIKRSHEILRRELGEQKKATAKAHSAMLNVVMGEYARLEDGPYKEELGRVLRDAGEKMFKEKVNGKLQ